MGWWVTTRCRCGRIRDYKRQQLTKTRGCRSCRNPDKIWFETGEKFGDWEIVGLPISIKGANNYLVRCHCGTEAFRLATELKAGRAWHCGCRSTTYRSGEYITSGFLVKVEHNAKVRDISVNLTIPQLETLWLAQEGRCALSGAPLQLIKNNKDTSATASLDRIDSSGSYEIDNVQFIHKDLNLMKMQMDQDMFILWCIEVANYNNT